MAETEPNDKAIWHEMEHTKHGPEAYQHNESTTLKNHPKDHSHQQHTVHGNLDGDPVPHLQHDGPDEETARVPSRLDREQVDPEGLEEDLDM